MPALNLDVAIRTDDEQARIRHLARQELEQQQR